MLIDLPFSSPVFSIPARARARMQARARARMQARARARMQSDEFFHAE